jgi:hypothetical protein
MLAHGTPLHVVSDVLGHASITITKDVYGLPEQQERPYSGRGRAAELGALGETRTPNLLIRSRGKDVWPVRVGLFPQVRVHRVSEEDVRVRCRPTSV